MGFPGRGADFVAKQLSVGRRPSSVVLGVNIGKNKDTPNEEAAKDYVYLAGEILSTGRLSYHQCEFTKHGWFASPASTRSYLEDLLKQLGHKRNSLPDQRPILVKLAPDLTDDELDDALAAITVSRDGWRDRHKYNN